MVGLRGRADLCWQSPHQSTDRLRPDWSDCDIRSARTGVWGIGVALAIVLVVGLGVARGRGSVVTSCGDRHQSRPRCSSARSSFLLLRAYGRSGRGLGAAIAFSPERAREQIPARSRRCCCRRSPSPRVTSFSDGDFSTAPCSLCFDRHSRQRTHTRQSRTDRRSQYLTYKRALLAVPRLPSANELPSDLQLRVRRHGRLAGQRGSRQVNFPARTTVHARATRNYSSSP